MIDPWTERDLEFYWAWDSGETHLKDAEDNYITLRLDPMYVLKPDGAYELAEYRPKVANANGPEYWHNVRLAPIGSVEPPALEVKLPYYNYDNTTQEAYKALGRYVLEYVIEEANIKMLHGTFVVPAPGNGCVIDILRMIHLKAAMTDGADCFVAVFCTRSGGVALAQNGGGGGPPPPSVARSRL
jgi:hypothetical protein